MGGTDDILGHAQILAHFRDAVGRDRLHHAYLFEGRAGLGKSLVAQWLAMAANCESSARPCGVCPSCVRIGAGTHPDVITVVPEPGRATPTIRVDQIREVVRKAGYHRYEAARRFVIVDPAEAMAPAAANALLKTLEEPPLGTHFLLITATPSALLPTILSRCQRVRFAAVPTPAIEAWLEAQHLADAGRCAHLAQGSPGLALALARGGLQERLALRAEVLDILGADLGTLTRWTDKLCTGGRAAWTPRVEAVIELLEELLRDVVIAGAGSAQPLLHEDLSPVLDAWVEVLWPGGVARCARAVADTRAALEANANGRLAMDALLTRVATELGRARRAGRATGSR